TLAAAALAGLLLAVGGLLLGVVTDLADRHGEAADLEAQGVTPSVLRQLATTRMAVLVGAGAVAGTAVGLVLSAVVTSALSLTADGLVPIPPLVAAVPIATIAIIVGAVVIGVLAVTAGLANRAYGAATLGERRAGRAGRARNRHATRVLPAERIDG
ncbi:MAG: FtsX-like permease family protein, partial [Candidatus Limnocylindrales bacterium]